MTPPGPLDLPDLPLRVPARPEDTDADARRIYDALVLAARSLGLDPDVERVADVYDPSCPCYGDFVASVTRSVEQGRRTTWPLPEILSFTVLSGSVEDGEFAVDVVRRIRGTEYAHDEHGAVHAERPLPDQYSQVRATISRQDGLWRWTLIGIRNLEGPS